MTDDVLDEKETKTREMDEISDNSIQSRNSTDAF